MKKDHRELGKEMDLFSFHEEAPGFPFYKENFLIIRKQLLNFLLAEQKKLGYTLIQTPAIVRQSLMLQSGHWDFYRDNMYWIQHDENIIDIMKPMNCPGGILVYKEDSHSYRELPIKIAEIGRVYRKEQSGSINGIFRTREYLMDDAHIYLQREQLDFVLNEILDLVEKIYSNLGFDYKISLSTRPEKSIGSDDIWASAISILKGVLEKRGSIFQIKKGDGAFYGPKIDFDIQDSQGRLWQCGTIQLDFNLPQRFNITCQNSDAKEEPIIMIHRAILGGIERFIAILLEHYGGKLPLWLAPEQVIILPLNTEIENYAYEIKEILNSKNIRSKVDSRAETLDKRLRESIIRKINYAIILGSRELNAKTISVRRRDGKKMNQISIKDFLYNLSHEIKSKEIAHY